MLKKKKKIHHQENGVFVSFHSIIKCLGSISAENCVYGKNTDVCNTITSDPSGIQAAFAGTMWHNGKNSAKGIFCVFSTKAAWWRHMM